MRLKKEIGLGIGDDGSHRLRATAGRQRRALGALLAFMMAAEFELQVAFALRIRLKRVRNQVDGHRCREFFQRLRRLYRSK